MTLQAGELIEDPMLTKPSQTSIKQEVKRQKERNINNMNSFAIAWHLTYKHRVGLLMLTNLGFIAYLILRG